MLTRLFFIISICLFWLVIAGIDGIKHYPSLSIISIILVISISISLKISSQKYLNPLKFISYSLWLIREIIISSCQVTKIIWSPKLDISPRIVELGVKLKDNAAAQVIYANSITLTPGTYTIDIDENSIFIHALTTEHIRDLASGSLQKRVRNYFGS